MQPSIAPRDGLLRSTLVGEYACIALVLHAAIGSVVWTVRSASDPAGLVVVAAGCWIIGRSTGAFARLGFTPLVSVGLLVALLTLCDIGTTSSLSLWTLISPTAFVGMLLVILVVDLLELATTNRGHAVVGKLRRWNWFRIAIWSCGIALATYLVLIPAVALLVEQLRPAETSRVLEDMSLAEYVRVRTTEALTALVFFSLGAAVGSFLNVVAYRAPRGQSIAFQRSRCPSCGIQISGRDNIPILGWLMLKGRCRTCAAPVSPRYPAIEALTASVFLLLYFVELISGGENIPVRRPNYYNGVVWIIFYTKWDLVGLYLFHCLTIFALLTWALIDAEARRVPAWLRWSVAVVLGALPAISSDLLPVSWWGGGTPPPSLPGWVSSSAIGTSVLGGLVGALLGWLASIAVASTSTTNAGRGQGPHGGNAVSAGLTVGLSLGWQAAVGVWLLTLALRPIAALATRHVGLSDPPLTALVLVAYVVQLVCWRGLTVSWWPSANTSVTAWVVLSLVMVAFWAVNRVIPPQPSSRDEARETATPSDLVTDLVEP